MLSFSKLDQHVASIIHQRRILIFYVPMKPWTDEAAYMATPLVTYIAERHTTNIRHNGLDMNNVLEIE